MVLAFDGNLEYGEYLEAGTAGDVALDEGALRSEDMHDGQGNDAGDMRFRYCTETVLELKPGEANHRQVGLLRHGLITGEEHTAAQAAKGEPRIRSRAHGQAG